MKTSAIAGGAQTMVLDTAQWLIISATEQAHEASLEPDHARHTDATLKSGTASFAGVV